MQELLDCLKSELTGNFEMVVVGLMMPAPVYDSYELKNAIKVSEDWEMCEATYGILFFTWEHFYLNVQDFWSQTLPAVLTVQQQPVMLLHVANLYFL